MSGNQNFFQERRQQDRLMKMYKPAFVKSEGGSFVGVLRDLSSSGAGIDVGDHDVSVGQPVRYCWGDRDQISGKVVWADAGLIGVAHDTIDADFDAALERYRSVRIPFSAPANIYLDGRRLAAETINFAQRGFCALVCGEVRQGALATIEIGRRCFQSATAKWVDGERVGFSLNQAIPLHQMNAMQKGA